MKIVATIDYAASPEQVFAMLTDEAFQSRKCEGTGALNHAVSITTNGDRTVIVSKRTMPTNGFPDFVKNLVGTALIVTETNDWGPDAGDGSREGRLTVDIGGAPIAMGGTLTLTPGGQGTVETVEGDLKARIPLLGGKIEQAAAPAIESAIKVERTVGTAWLAG